jgi:PhnB protein
MTAKPIPEGFHTVTPVLTVEGGVEALSFYERAFGAKVVRRLVMGGKLMHSEIRIGDSMVSVSDAFPEFGSVAPDRDGPVPVAMLIYTEDADASYARAVEAGATGVNPPADQFHGDHAGSLRDPYGHRWMIATHTEDMSEEEMQRRTEEAMAGSKP